MRPAQHTPPEFLGYTAREVRGEAEGALNQGSVSESPVEQKSLVEAVTPFTQ